MKKIYAQSISFDEVITLAKIKKKKRWHVFFDEGTNVYSTKWGGKGFGAKCVGIWHCVLSITDLVTFSVCALSAFKVKKGDKITRGQLIGLVGSTGNLRTLALRN